MLPYGLNQKVEFKISALLGDLDLNEMSSLDEVDFVEKVYPVYKAIDLVKNDKLTVNKSIIGFVGAPWTLLVYMINRQSPKKNLKKDFFTDDFLIEF